MRRRRVGSPGLRRLAGVGAAWLLALACGIAVFAQAPLADSAGPAGEPPRFLGARAIAIVGEHIDGMPFKIPQGVHYDPVHDEVFVADSGNGRIGIYDGRGVPKFSFSTGRELSYPVGVATDAAGNVFVMEAGGRSVHVFNYRGEPLRVVDLGAADGADVLGSGLAIGPDGRLYVLDSAVGRIAVYGADGVLAHVIRGSGRGGSRLQAPGGIAFDPSGGFYVTDRRGTPVQVFDSAGRFLRGWGRHELGAEGFSAPAGVAVDSYGNVLVADPLRQDIKVFDATGAFQEHFGGFGRRPGEVAYPTAIATGPDGRVFVVERVGARLQIFQRMALGDGPNSAGPSRQPAQPR